MDKKKKFHLSDYWFPILTNILFIIMLLYMMFVKVYSGPGWEGLEDFFKLLTLIFAISIIYIWFIKSFERKLLFSFLNAFSIVILLIWLIISSSLDGHFDLDDFYEIFLIIFFLVFVPALITWLPKWFYYEFIKLE